MLVKQFAGVSRVINDDEYFTTVLMSPELRGRA